MTEAPALELAGASLAYDGARVLSDLSLSLSPGESAGILGGEGSGKSSLLRLCAGLVPPASGAVRLFGHDTHEAGAAGGAGLRRLQARIGFVHHTGGLLSNQTLIENLRLPLRYHNLWDAERAHQLDGLVEALDLSGWLDRLPAEIPETVQRRARMARALSLRPGLLLLDQIADGASLDALRRMGEAVERAVSNWKTAVVAVGSTPASLSGLAPPRFRLHNGRLERE